MADDFARVSPGQPRTAMSANAWNACLDAAEDFRRRRLGGGGRPLGLEQRPSGLLLVQNNSGADREQFDVLGIDVPLTLPADNEAEFRSRLAVSGILPALIHSLGHVVVLLEPLATGRIGWGCVSGVCQVQVDILSAATWYARPTVAGDYLTSASGGCARIIYKPAATGLQWCLVQLGLPPNHFWARLTDAAAIDSSTDPWRWQYAWQEAVWNGAGSSVLTGGRSGTTSTNYALNGMEVDNATSGVVNGVDVDGTDYPPGFEPRPLTYGSKTHMVPMYETVDASGSLVYRICLPGGHDGPCELVTS